MKLATLRDGSRDGQLIVVSRDLKHAHYASTIAPSLQRALDDWNFIAPQLQDLYDALNQGKASQAFTFDPRQCMAPLPRAYQWVDSLAYGSARRSDYWGLADAALPTLVPSAGGHLLGAHDGVRAPASTNGVDAIAGLAVATGDLPQGASVEAAADAIRLVTLFTTIVLRPVLAQERGQGYGLALSRPYTLFAPVALTRDELGESWTQSSLDGLLSVQRNGEALAPVPTAKDLDFNFAELIAYLCRTQPCRTGALIGSGPVAAPVELAEGDTLEIRYLDPAGAAPFGSIELVIQALETPSPSSR